MQTTQISPIALGSLRSQAQSAQQRPPQSSVQAAGDTPSGGTAGYDAKPSFTSYSPGPAATVNISSPALAANVATQSFANAQPSFQTDPPPPGQTEPSQISAPPSAEEPTASDN
jgi:hypothetical protein